MSSSNRLPVHKRAKDPPGVDVVIPRQGDVIEAAATARMLQQEYIIKLFYPGQKRTGQRDLQHLYHHKYLDRDWNFTQRGQTVTNTPPFYILDRKGERYLIQERGYRREKLKWYPGRDKLSAENKSHPLRVSQFWAVAKLAARKRGDEIVEWLSELELKRMGMEVWDPKVEEQAAFVPDGFGVYLLGDTGQRKPFFLEVDRSTERSKVWARKIRLYGEFLKSGAYREYFPDTDRYGSGQPIILTAAKSKWRVRNLKKTTEEEGGRRRYWFTDFSSLDEEKILGSVWRVATDRGIFSFVE